MTGRWKIMRGDCVEKMGILAAGSIDAVVTDPPYGIGFMGHEWDQPSPEHAAVSASHGGCNVSYGGLPHPAMEAGRYDLSSTANRRFQAWCEAWGVEALRVLKPGGHAVVFGSTRTYHRLAAGLEDAGFEIRDTLAWMFGSGFPKSRNLDGDWDGWGTALKPGYEPIVLARKPLSGTVAVTVSTHGTGALNIDGCRIGFADDRDRATVDGAQFVQTNSTRVAYGEFEHDGGVREAKAHDAGRWPANVLLDEQAAEVLDKQTGTLTSGDGAVKRASAADADGNQGAAYGAESRPAGAEMVSYGDSGGASRFFYCAKAGTAERNAGLDGFEAQAPPTWSNGEANPGAFQDGQTAARANVHPTVKPIDVMRWLVKLVTPPGGVVLDPFAGSGTTGCAATLEGFEFIGIERDPDYADVAESRIRFWSSFPADADTEAVLVFERRRHEVAATGQTSLLGLDTARENGEDG